MTTTTFGQQVQERRKEKGLTVSELARLAGVSQPTLWRIEEGQEPKLSAAVAIARALDSNVYRLLKSDSTNAKKHTRKRKRTNPF